jgi:hypothetical protein
MTEIVVEVPDEIAEVLDGFEFAGGPELLRAALAESTGRAHVLAQDTNGDAAELLAAGERIVVLSRAYGEVAEA